MKLRTLNENLGIQRCSREATGEKPGRVKGKRIKKGSQRGGTTKFTLARKAKQKKEGGGKILIPKYKRERGGQLVFLMETIPKGGRKGSRERGIPQGGSVMAG